MARNKTTRNKNNQPEYYYLSRHPVIDKDPQHFNHIKKSFSFLAANGKSISTNTYEVQRKEYSIVLVPVFLRKDMRHLAVYYSDGKQCLLDNSKIEYHDSTPYYIVSDLKKERLYTKFEINNLQEYFDINGDLIIKQESSSIFECGGKFSYGTDLNSSIRVYSEDDINELNRKKRDKKLIDEFQSNKPTLRKYPSKSGDRLYVHNPKYLSAAEMKNQNVKSVTTVDGGTPNRYVMEYGQPLEGKRNTIFSVDNGRILFLQLFNNDFLQIYPKKHSFITRLLMFADTGKNVPASKLEQIVFCKGKYSLQGGGNIILKRQLINNFLKKRNFEEVTQDTSNESASAPKKSKRSDKTDNPSALIDVSSINSEQGQQHSVSTSNPTLNLSDSAESMFYNQTVAESNSPDNYDFDSLNSQAEGCENGFWSELETRPLNGFGFFNSSPKTSPFEPYIPPFESDEDIDKIDIDSFYA